MKHIQSLFEGAWNIKEMEKWDQRAINLVSQAEISFDYDGTGDFIFIAVKGFTDCRYSENKGKPFVEFSWQGRDERDDANGRGWAIINGQNELEGHIFIHCGEDSSFKAYRKNKEKCH